MRGAETEAVQEQSGLAVSHFGDPQLDAGGLQAQLVDRRLQGVGRKDIGFGFQE